MQRILKYGFVSAFAIALGIFGVFAFYLNWAHTGGPNDLEVEVIIERGSSAHQIGRELKKAGVITSPFMFFSYLRVFTRASGKLQSGDYLIPPHTTPERIIYMLEHGLQREFRFTIPEGSTLKDIVDIIARTGLASHEALETAIKNPLLTEEFKIPAEVKGGIEGYLFPDTYIFQAGTLPMTIFRHMHDQLLKNITPEMYGRMAELGMTLNEVLTMASLVEKETGNKAERPLIAGVFFNRLRKGIKLQTDPSVVYGVKRTKGKRIAKKDLGHKHEYNTYIHAGLPPGPIAAPGLAAIKAVLWPTPSKYLFFVAKGNGTHEFCVNYGCHTAAIRQYLKKPKEVPVQTEEPIYIENRGR
jgi:UPF0755 protein